MAKSKDAFRTIGEVAEWLDTPAHVLRFWESKFTQIKPVKRAGGRRYYRPSDMALLGGIKVLLHDDGMTIKGTQKLLREKGIRHVQGMSPVLPGEAIEAEAAIAETVETAAKVVPMEGPAPAVEETPAEGPDAIDSRPEALLPEESPAPAVPEASAAATGPGEAHGQGHRNAPLAETPDEQAAPPSPAAEPLAEGSHRSPSEPEPGASAPAEAGTDAPSLFPGLDRPEDSGGTRPAGAADPEPETAREPAPDLHARFAAALAAIPADPGDSEAAPRGPGALSALARATPATLEIRAKALAPFVARLEALRDRLKVD